MLNWIFEIELFDHLIVYLKNVFTNDTFNVKTEFGFK